MPPKNSPSKAAHAQAKIPKSALESLTKALAHAVSNAKAKVKHPPRRKERGGAGFDALMNVTGKTGRLGLASSNRAGTRRSQVIEEDEYIGEITGSTTFNSTSWFINPGQSLTFPWASGIAAKYERYVFEFCEFYYRREVSEYATNGQTGKVILSCDYDASDSPPASKQAAENTVPHVDGMPCVERLSLRLDPKQLNGGSVGTVLGKFVRPGSVPPGSDIKTFDAGLLSVSTYGCANSSSPIGELRVKYRVRFHVPVLESPTLYYPGQEAVLIDIAGDLVATTTSGVTGTCFQGQQDFLVNNIGATISSTGVITLPAGHTYLLEGGMFAVASADAATMTNAIVRLGQSTTYANFFTGSSSTGQTSGITMTGTGINVGLVGCTLNTAAFGVGQQFALNYSVTSGTNGHATLNPWMRITLLV